MCCRQQVYLSRRPSTLTPKTIELCHVLAIKIYLALLSARGRWQANMFPPESSSKKAHSEKWLHCNTAFCIRQETCLQASKQSTHYWKQDETLPQSVFGKVVIHERFRPSTLDLVARMLSIAYSRRSRGLAACAPKSASAVKYRDDIAALSTQRCRVHYSDTCPARPAVRKCCYYYLKVVLTSRSVFIPT